MFMKFTDIVNWGRGVSEGRENTEGSREVGNMDGNQEIHLRKVRLIHQIFRRVPWKAVMQEET